MATFEKIATLANQLFPRGRAFKNVLGGTRQKLIFGISTEWERLWNGMLSLMDSAIPDVNGFDESDASAWERFYGIKDGGLAGLSLEERRLAILQKMNFPNGQAARQNFKFIEEQLRTAGFDVYVYENKFPTYPSGYITMTPEELGLGSDSVQYGDNDYGEFGYGDSQYPNIVANHITQVGDADFNIGDGWFATFFVGGPTLGEFANVSQLREKELRQLILKMKPAQTVGFLLVNFT